MLGQAVDIILLSFAHYKRSNIFKAFLRYEISVGIDKFVGNLFDLICDFRDILVSYFIGIRGILSSLEYHHLTAYAVCGSINCSLAYCNAFG